MPFLPGRGLVLTNNDESHLGLMLNSEAAFIEKIKQRRGNTVCVYLELRDVDGGDGPGVPLDLRAFVLLSNNHQASLDENSTTNIHIKASFAQRFRDFLYEYSLKLEDSEPIRCLLSGRGAHYSVRNQRLKYGSEELVCKLVPTSGYDGGEPVPDEQLWFREVHDDDEEDDAPQVNQTQSTQRRSQNGPVAAKPGPKPDPKPVAKPDVKPNVKTVVVKTEIETQAHNHFEGGSTQNGRRNRATPPQPAPQPTPAVRVKEEPMDTRPISLDRSPTAARNGSVGVARDPRRQPSIQPESRVESSPRQSQSDPRVAPEAPAEPAEPVAPAAPAEPAEPVAPAATPQRKRSSADDEDEGWFDTPKSRSNGNANGTHSQSPRKRARRDDVPQPAAAAVPDVAIETQALLAEAEAGGLADQEQPASTQPTQDNSNGQSSSATWPPRRGPAINGHQPAFAKPAPPPAKSATQTRSISPIGSSQLNNTYNFLCIVHGFTEPRSTTGGNGKWSQQLVLVDRSGWLKTMCFSLRLEDLVQDLQPGMVLLISGCRVKQWVGSTQQQRQGNIDAATGETTWAALPPPDSPVASIPHSLAGGQLHPPPSEAEFKEMRALSEWYHRAGGAREITLRWPQARLRTLKRVCDITSATEPEWFDIIGEVVAVMAPEGAPLEGPSKRPVDLYLTDYTANAETRAVFDQHLGYFEDEYSPRTEDGPGGGLVLRLALWDKQAYVVHSLSKGKYVLVQNVRSKFHEEYGISGTVGGEQDLNLKIRDASDHVKLPALLERKRAWTEEREKVLAMRRAEEEDNEEAWREMHGQEHVVHAPPVFSQQEQEQQQQQEQHQEHQQEHAEGSAQMSTTEDEESHEAVRNGAHGGEDVEMRGSEQGSQSRDQDEDQAQRPAVAEAEAAMPSASPELLRATTSALPTATSLQEQHASTSASAEAEAANREGTRSSPLTSPPERATDLPQEAGAGADSGADGALTQPNGVPTRRRPRPRPRHRLELTQEAIRSAPLLTVPEVKALEPPAAGAGPAAGNGKGGDVPPGVVLARVRASIVDVSPRSAGEWFRPAPARASAKGKGKGKQRADGGGTQSAETEQGEKEGQDKVLTLALLLQQEGHAALEPEWCLPLIVAKDAALRFLGEGAERSEDTRRSEEFEPAQGEGSGSARPASAEAGAGAHGLVPVSAQPALLSRAVSTLAGLRGRGVPAPREGEATADATAEEEQADEDEEATANPPVHEWGVCVWRAKKTGKKVVSIWGCEVREGEEGPGSRSQEQERDGLAETSTGDGNGM